MPALSLAAVLLVAVAIPRLAAAAVEPGTPLPVTAIFALDGTREELVPDGARAAVLVFFRGGQERSGDALAEVAGAQALLAAKPVRWLGVVPADADAAEVQALAAGAGAALPLARDPGDRLYAELGLSLHPVVVVLERGRAVAAIEPFQPAGFRALLQARIRRALGELGEAEAARLAAPEPSPLPGADRVKASMRYVHLGRKLLASAPDKAAECARRALAVAPSAAAHALLGDALAAAGSCAEAREAWETAVALGGSEGAEISGEGRCGR